MFVQLHQLAFLQAGKSYHQQKGKMNIHLTLIAVILISMCEVLTVNVMLELKNKLKVRKLFSKRDLFHVYTMLKQRKSWDNLESD